MITCPMLALWDAGGIPNKTSGPLVIWREWSPRAQGQPIKSGHFLAEENPAATVTALIDFFAAT
jgi:haloacetate dehalogenase